LCDKLSDIESRRQHAIYNNLNKYSQFINFQQIEKFDLLPNAIEALTGFESKLVASEPLDLGNNQLLYSKG